jgi:hypothetical protein
MAFWLVIVAALAGLAFAYGFCVREHNSRTRVLTELALTARLDDVVKDESIHKVVETNFGHGKEFWTVPEGEVAVDRRSRVIIDGRRIMSGLSPARTRRALLDGGKTVERMVVRF